ncbi:hypothetical protein MNBD_GAMMA13-1945 [hydrothermal vent metagenome]|uniref:Cytochrome c domain-containing protein n=1 Tax=hydrothermal vent metagenome TaxID=652676 RepID=A0A3B0YL71_9ZZZZ
MNMKYLLITMTLALLAGQSSADVKHGQQLHDASCVKCHDNGVYTRKDRFVGDKNALTTQVQRCKANVGAQWFDEDVADVVDFLDTSYYKFPLPAVAPPVE